MWLSSKKNHHDFIEIKIKCSHPFYKINCHPRVLLKSRFYKLPRGLVSTVFHGESLIKGNFAKHQQGLFKRHQKCPICRLFLYGN